MGQKTDRIGQKEDRMGQKEDRIRLKKDRKDSLGVPKIMQKHFWYLLLALVIFPTARYAQELKR